MPGKKTIVFSKDIRASETLHAGGGTSIIHNGVRPGQELSHVPVSELPGGHGSSEVRIQFDGELTGKNISAGQGYAAAVNYVDAEGSAKKDEARNNFNARVQNDTENVDDYAQELRQLARNCNFPNDEEELLKQFIRGVRDDVIRTRLQKKKGISFEKAVITAEVMEEEKLEQATTPKQP